MEGLVLWGLEPASDERGFFARAYDVDQFSTGILQVNLSFNVRKGTVRGLHWQISPHGETKIVRCVRGAMYDVAVDIRPSSATYLRWFGCQLDSENRNCLLIPEGFAHGFQTLADDTEVLYLMGSKHCVEASRGARFDDKSFGIHWPLSVAVISERDLAFPAFAEEQPCVS